MMLEMSKKNGAAPPRAGTAAAARASTPLRPVTPAKPKRRTFTAEYKQGILGGEPDRRLFESHRTLGLP